MSKNILQVYTDNPIVTNQSTDLMYFGRSPYGLGDDTAMRFVDFAAQFGSPFTPSALTRTNDTNVTATLGGTPATALLQAVSITLGWTGQLSPARGGTGVNNGTNTLTLAGNLTTVGAFSSTFTMTNTTNVTFPTSGTLATTSQIPTGAALTKTDDTNVTLTLGGSPSTALVNAASLTLGWTGTLSGTRGGTGVNNGASTITVGGNFSTAAAHTLAGAFASTFTLTNTTSVTFPTSGTLATTAQLPTPSALTKTDDTNVTLTLGGTPATSLLQAVSLTLGWTGSLSVPRGGTGMTSATAYAVLCGGTTSTSAHQSIASVGTAGQVLTSNGAGALPTFQTGVGTVTAWVAYTPTFTGFGTVSNVQIWSRRVGDVLQIRGRFQGGTTTATEARITLGYAGTNANVASTSTTITSIQQAGGFCIFNYNSTPVYQPMIEANSLYFVFGVQASSAAGLTKLNGNDLLLANNVMSFTCNIPVDSWP